MSGEHRTGTRVNIHGENSWLHKVLQRYPIAVYLLIATLGILCITAAMRRESFAAALLNIGGGLVVAAVIFLVLRLFLIDQDELLVQQIETMIQSINANGPQFTTQTETGLSSVIEALKHAESADFCGYTLDRFVASAKEVLKERLIRGAHVRFLIVSQEGAAHELMTKFSEAGPMIHNTGYTIGFLRTVYAEVLAIGREPQMEIRMTEWIPSCALYVTRDGGESAGEIQVELYPPYFGSPPGGRPVFSLTYKRDGPWFEYFCGQFQKLWDAATPVRLKTPLEQRRGGA